MVVIRPSRDQIVWSKCLTQTLLRCAVPRYFVTIFQVTTAKTHSVKEGGVKWLQGLGVERFRYIAVSTPNTPLDLPFPNEWNGSTGPSIPEKYLLTLESLPEH